MDRFVLRFEKYNKGAGLRGILDHCARRKTPKNADPERAFLNRVAGDSTPSNFVVAGRKRVAAVETVISVSREWYRDVGEAGWESYVQDALGFLEAEFGGPPMFTAQHYDELSPHVHILHCPHAMGTSAKAMIGGSKYRLAELQTSFEEEVAQRYGLHRIKGALGNHTKLREFYAGVDEQFRGEAWRVQPKRLLDELQSAAQFAQLRASDIVRRYLAGDEVLLQMISDELEQEDIDGEAGTVDWM